MLSWFDSAYHGLPVDYIVLTDRLAFLLLISIMAFIFSRMLRDYTFERYRTGQKHAREISALMEIGRTISSREELATALASIVSETMKLLQADLGFIGVRSGENGKLEIIADSGPVAGGRAVRRRMPHRLYHHGVGQAARDRSGRAGCRRGHGCSPFEALDPARGRAPDRG